MRGVSTPSGVGNRSTLANAPPRLQNSVPQRTADEVYQLLVDSKKAAGDPPMLPHGLEANRHNLEVAIDCAYQQKLIPKRFTVEELLR